MPAHFTEKEKSEAAKTSPRHDTSRSWRAMRLLICLIVATLTALGCGVSYFSWQFEIRNYAYGEVAKINFVPPAGDKAVDSSTGTNFDPAALGLRPFNPVKDGVANLDTPYGTWSWKKIQEIAATPLALITVQAIGLGILAGFGGWIGAWLLIVAIAFVWWFILDRIREFARAIKGQP
jgi:hypothetical protein